MDINVELVPPDTGTLLPTPDGREGERLALVVDVLRSATAASVLLERGVPELILTDSLRAARRVAARDGAWLVGEREGMPPEGFNFGNSPAALRRASLGGKPAVLLAAESPRALALAAATGRVALVGLGNAPAIARLVAEAEPARIDLVCAGLGGAPDLADVVAAGLLVSLLARRGPRQEREVTLEGAADFCLSVLRMTSDPLDGLWVSASGAALRAAGFEEDLAMASAVGTTETIPWVTSVEEVAGRSVIRLAPEN